MDEFIRVSVDGIPLVAVVLGLVEWVKSLGVKGNHLRAASMGIGVALGVAHQVSTLGPPPYTNPVAFGVVFYGLALGLVASGIYDAAAKRGSQP